MTIATRNVDQKTILTLSAVPDLTPEDARVASLIDRVLSLVEYWRQMGQARAADTLLDDLFDYVLGDRRRVPSDAITESERRLLDGNR